MTKTMTEFPWEFMYGWTVGVVGCLIGTVWHHYSNRHKHHRSRRTHHE
jgi:hypothetical protein